MSRPIKKQITCPNCNKESEFTIWTSLNTALDPEKKELFLSQELFKFRCPHCGAETVVDYSMLYHQMEDKRMIYYVPRDEDVPEIMSFMQGMMPNTENDELVGVLNDGMDEYIHRIVRTRNNLVEKARIFEDGRDDRIIEIAKIFLAAQIYEQEPDFDDFMLYYDGDKDKIQFAVVGSEKSYGQVKITEELYEALKKDFGEKLPPITEKEDLIIDFAWASKILGFNQ